jgi:hypothetical protein
VTPIRMTAAYSRGRGAPCRYTCIGSLRA